MKTALAVIETVGDFVINSKEFSAWDITKTIRDHEENSDEMLLNDDNANMILHSDVREIVRALYNNGLIVDYKKEFRRTNDRSFTVYTPVDGQTVTPSASVSTSGLADGLTAVSTSVQNVIASQKQLISPDFSDKITEKIRTYLQNKKNRGENVTIKQIQSRLNYNQGS